MSIAMMSAGRELDALVAHKVMGKPRYYADDVMYGQLPAYSTDIAAAWEVVLKLYRKGIPTPTVNAFSGGWYCSFGPEANATVKKDKRGAPLAICRAALKAVLK